MTDTVILNNFCCTILNGILAAPGWASPAQNWRAGEILEDVLLPLAIPSEPRGDTTAYREWSHAQVVVPLTKRQVEVVTACVKHFAEAKGLPPVFALRPLLILAGLKPEE